MILEICFQNFLLNKTKKETAKMIPHLAVSSFYLFLYHTLVDLFFFKTDSLHSSGAHQESPHPAEILLGTGIIRPCAPTFLHSFSIAIASAVVWNVITSFNSFFLIIQSQFQIQSPSR